MDVKGFVAQGWSDHATDAEGVFARFGEGVALVSEPEDLVRLAGLIVHVAGEHLGRWHDGLALLGQLEAHAMFDEGTDEGRSLLRSMAVLHQCAGNAAERAACARRGGGDSPASAEVRINAVAASALAGQRRTADAIRAFKAATEHAAYGPDASDPAARSLAITGNNLACDLEEKADRTADEDTLLLRAAQTARKYWAIAGTWQNVKIAEYRLARTNLALGRAAAALEHANRGLGIAQINDAGPSDLFFCWEAIALARHALGEGDWAVEARGEAACDLEGMDEGDFRSYCAGELANLDTLLGV